MLLKLRKTINKCLYSQMFIRTEEKNRAMAILQASAGPEAHKPTIGPPNQPAPSFRLGHILSVGARPISALRRHRPPSDGSHAFHRNKTLWITIPRNPRPHSPLPRAPRM
jgi:hypothetical protein